MNLAVIKNPDANTIARCRELGEATAPLFDGEELMTQEQLTAWENEPAQVAKRQEAIQAAEAARIAADIASDEDEIAKFIAMWDCLRVQAIYELTWRKVLKVVKE